MKKLKEMKEITGMHKIWSHCYQLSAIIFFFKNMFFFKSVLIQQVKQAAIYIFSQMMGLHIISSWITHF